MEETAPEVKAAPEVTSAINDPLAGVSEEQIKLILALGKQAEEDAANIEPENEDPEKVSRELEIKSDKRYGLWVVKRAGGGKVPKILQGQYTDFEHLKQQIELYERGLLVPQIIHATNTHLPKPNTIQADKK